MLRRRGSPEAGAIFIKVDCLDGTAVLFGPAPQSDYGESAERRFVPLHDAPRISTPDAESRLRREITFDPDLWIVEIDDREGRTFLERNP